MTRLWRKRFLLSHLEVHAAFVYVHVPPGSIIILFCIPDFNNLSSPLFAPPRRSSRSADHTLLSHALFSCFNTKGISAEYKVLRVQRIIHRPFRRSRYQLGYNGDRKCPAGDRKPLENSVAARLTARSNNPCEPYCSQLLVYLYVKNSVILLNEE